MVAPIITTPLKSDTITTTDSWQNSDSVAVYDADSFSFEIRHLDDPGSNPINYRVQVSSDDDSWSDWIESTSLAAGASFAQSYPEESFRYIRVGVLQDTAGEDVEYSVSVRREKVI